MLGTTDAINIPMDDLPIVLHCDVESRRVFLKAAKEAVLNDNEAL
jgi:hypothetical protein